MIDERKDERADIRDLKDERRSVDSSLEILRNHIRANNSLGPPLVR